MFYIAWHWKNGLTRNNTDKRVHQYLIKIRFYWYSSTHHRYSFFLVWVWQDENSFFQLSMNPQHDYWFRQWQQHEKKCFRICSCHSLADSEFPTKGVVFWYIRWIFICASSLLNYTIHNAFQLWGLCEFLIKEQDRKQFQPAILSVQTISCGLIFSYPLKHDSLRVSINLYATISK